MNLLPCNGPKRTSLIHAGLPEYYTESPFCFKTGRAYIRLLHVTALTSEICKSKVLWEVCGQKELALCESGQQTSHRESTFVKLALPSGPVKISF